MKRIFKLLFVLILFTLIIKLFIYLFTKQHNIEYVIKNKSNKYTIKESYIKNNNSDLYSFDVTLKKKRFVFAYNHDYNKRKKIITDIKYFKKNNLECIFPIFKDEMTSDIYCNYDGGQVSYSYLKQINNEEIINFEKQLSKKYKLKTLHEDSVPSKIDNITVYKENVKDNLLFIMWNYKGFYIINKNEVLNKRLLKNDHYENNISYLVDNYYVFINTDEESTISYPSFYVYNLKRNTNKNYKFNDELAKNFYFNGVYDKKLYFTDLKLKKQYALKPSSGKIKEIGTKENGFYSVVDNKLKKVETKDYFTDRKVFDNTVNDSVLNKDDNIVTVKKGSNCYYYETKDGSIYKVYNDNYDNPVLLFKFPSISEWKIKDNRIIVVTEKYLYYYDDQYGLLEILENNELIYNYKNICDFVKL